MKVWKKKRTGSDLVLCLVNGFFLLGLLVSKLGLVMSPLLFVTGGMAIGIGIFVPLFLICQVEDWKEEMAKREEEIKKRTAGRAKEERNYYKTQNIEAKCG